MISLTSKTDRAMKKIMNFAAALAVILTASCNKDIVTPEGEGLVKTGVKVVMNADIEPVTRMALNDNVFSWEDGDVVNLRWANKYTDETLTASYDAEKSRIVFAGTFVNDIPVSNGQVENLYAYFAKDGSWYSSNSVGVVKEIPVQQTGKLEDIDEYAVYAAFIQKKTITATFEEDKVTALAFDADMKPYFSLVKMTVPVELGLTSITLNSDADVSGRLCANPSKISDNAHNNVFGTGAAQLVNMDTDGRSTSIVVSRGGSVISGDVYFVIAPDEYDSAANAYGCSATSLKFTFSTSSESYEYEASLAEKIQMGDLKYLGAIPMSIKTPKVEAGSICLTDDVNFTVSVTNPNAQCVYYYEIATSAADCKTPTTSSAQLNLAEGIVPDMNSTYNEYFIKILAHYTGEEDYRDCLMKAQVRYWKFNKNCPTAAVYRDAVNSLANQGDQVISSDGLVIRRRATANLTYAEGTGSIEYNNCILPFMQVLRDADVYIYMSTSNHYNNASSKTFNLSYTNNNFSNLNRTGDFNGTNNTKTAVTRPEGSDGSNHLASVVWNLGSLDKRYLLAFTPDSKMTAYGQGILEVL